MRPVPEIQAALDTALLHASPPAQERFEEALEADRVLIRVHEGTHTPVQSRQTAVTPAVGNLVDELPQVKLRHSEDTRDDESDSQHKVDQALPELLHGFVWQPDGRPSSILIAQVERVRRSVDSTLGSTDNATLGQVDDLAAGVEVSAQQCVFAPPLRMLCQLALDLSEVQVLLSVRQRPHALQGLYRVTAQLATLIADELMVLGDARQSREWRHTAYSAADQTVDVALQADVRTLAALLPLYYGGSGEALSLVRQAKAILGPGRGLTSVLAPTYEALALAQRTAVAESEAALAVARSQVERHEPEYTGESVFGLSVRRWRFCEGKILSYLGRVDDAWTIHSQALALYPSDVIGDPALIRSDRSISLVHGGQLGSGCALATKTLTELPAELRVDIFGRAARRVLMAVPKESRNSPDVRRCREAIQSYGR